KDTNYVKDFSVDGFYGYSGWFTKDMATNTIKNKDGTLVVEKDVIMKINYVVPRTIQRKPEPGLDRIDQSKVALDKKFAFPDSAGQDVNVFIVDTGIRKTHEEFEGRAKSGGAFCDGCTSDDDGHGHGTQVAGIVAGKTFGVSKKSIVIAIKVLNDTGEGTMSDLLSGLTSVLAQHQNATNKNTIVSMSLGGPKTYAINSAVKALTHAGVHVVVAAGNDADDACNISPASEPSAITVGAVDIEPTDNKTNNIAYFSNFGKCVDIFAPGVHIKSAGNQDDNATLIFSGTSQATPHVSGTIALIIAKEGNKSPADMATALKTLSTTNAINFDAVLGAEKDSPNNLLRVPAA
ncbi:7284_t:CDS:2, partial [Cetraspora pellucida]